MDYKIQMQSIASVRNGKIMKEEAVLYINLLFLIINDRLIDYAKKRNVLCHYKVERSLK